VLVQRKTVTVLFCDVTGSTERGESLDPEALRSSWGRKDAVSSSRPRYELKGNVVMSERTRAQLVR
jgi:hypothetical protein